MNIIESKAFDLLVVCDHFRPGFKAGGPIVSVDTLTNALSDKLNILVVTRGRDMGDREHYPDIHLDSVVSRGGISVYYVDSFFGYLRALLFFRFSVVYLNSFFSPFCFAFFFRTLFLKRVRKIVAPRGELGEGALAIKRLKKSFFISLFNLFRFAKKFTFHATSQEEAECISQIFGVSSVVIPNISKLSSADRINSDKTQKVAKFVFLSRIARKKNLLAALVALQTLDPMYEVEFDIFGPIEDKSYWDSCQELIDSCLKNVKIRYLGPVRPSEISKVLQRYHALLLPTFNENYGHVIVEAMANGVIPVISDQTPWRNLQELGVGWDVCLLHSAALAQAIVGVLDLDGSGFQKMSKNAQNFIRGTIDHSSIADRYLKLFSI